MKKKILIISPIPTHPQDAGNKARLYRLILSLQQLGHDVFLLHVQQETGDIEQMSRFLGAGKLYSIEYMKNIVKKNIFEITSNKLIRKIKSIFNKDFIFIKKIDDWYDGSIDNFLFDISNKIDPDVVIVEYVFFSKSLQCFNENVLKIIDTHDIFTDRHKIYLKENQPPQWFSTSSSEEKKGLNRADVVLAIQDKEANFFSKILDNGVRVLTVGHQVNISQPEVYQGDGQKILFIGSSNPINVNGINLFIHNVFPRVRSEFPDSILLLAGSICDVLEDFDGCLKLGKMSDLSNAYELASLVISPIFFGTGLKVKSVEALGYAKPLVTTTVGAEGLENGAGSAFLVADSNEDFFMAIKNIFTDEILYESLSNNAHSFAKLWNQNCVLALQEALDINTRKMSD